jgi:3' terminal RNA ribose 2'-O-methyltransferase Hen1
MLLTLTTTHRPATDLGFLLHKNPDKAHKVDLTFGVAHGFFSEATEARATFALVLDIDAIALVRRRKRGERPIIEAYVNDRPYAASSFLSVGMARLLRTALNGVCKERPELAATAIPLTACVSPLAIRGDEGLPQALFGPLGYEVITTTTLLDETMPEWGLSAYVELKLSATCRLVDLLNHLYVLIPVLDRQKHYFVARDELDKLLQKAKAGWRATRPRS